MSAGLIAAVLLAGMLGITGIGGAAEFADESVIEKATKRGSLRIGFSTFLPWAMKDKN